MRIYGPSQVHGAQPLKGPHYLRQTSGAGPTQGADEVNISAAGEAAAQAADGDIRSDLVARVRNEIAAGTYESAEKLDAAIDRMLDAMG